MRFFSVALCILLTALASPAPAKVPVLPTAVKNPVDIAALSLEYDRDQGTYKGQGGVELKEGLRLLQADSVVYDEVKGQVFAEGRVVFKDGDDMVECEKLQLNLATKTGIIEQGRIYIKQGEFYISGQKIEKAGDEVYLIEKGELTTCGWEDPAWKFSAKNVEVTVEGYAKTTDANFYIAGKKAFYLPWGMFPVKTERQSGLLIPQILTSSRDGFVFRDAYFWAIAKDKDATFYLDYIWDRGPKIGADFRYALKDDLKGILYGSIINDDSYGGVRGQIRALHEQQLKYDVSLKANINYVSDYNYLRDFAYLKEFTLSKEFSLASVEPGTSFVEKSENLIKSNVFAEKPLPSSLLTAEAAYFKTLLQSSNKETLQYLPYLTFFTEYLPMAQGKLFTDLPASFVNFYRTEGESFSRFRFEPSLRLPYAKNGMNFLFSGSMMETAYFPYGDSATENTTEHREIFKFFADANTQLMRTYRLEVPRFDELQSVIKPSLKYSYISNSSFRDIPVLYPYDPYHLADRTYETNALTYAIQHYLNTTTSEGFREVSLFEIAQTYGLASDLNPSNLYQGFGNRFSDVSMRLTFFLRDYISLINQTSFNTYGDGVTSARTTLYYEQPKLFYFNVAHNYTQGLSDQVLFDGGLSVKDFDFRYFFQYSFRDSMYLNTMYQLVYHPKCWSIALGLVQSRNPDDTTIRLSVDLAGISSSKY